ncbi:hypothetical protein MTO96_007427 [Rhipicephalus appendiculatus]
MADTESARSARQPPRNSSLVKRTHLLGTELPREEEDAELLGPHAQVVAEPHNALGKHGVLFGVPILLEERSGACLRVPRLERARRPASRWMRG